MFFCVYWDLEDGMFLLFSLLCEGIRAELCNEGAGGDEIITNMKQGSYVS